MKTSEANTVDACDAKKHFSQLLERVAIGEKITITLQGKPVARLIPARTINSVETRKEAILKMRALASRNRLGGFPVQDLIAQGRK